MAHHLGTLLADVVDGGKPGTRRTRVLVDATRTDHLQAAFAGPANAALEGVVIDRLERARRMWPAFAARWQERVP